MKLRHLGIVEAVWPRFVAWDNRRKSRAVVGRLRARETRKPLVCDQIPGLISLVTTVWNTEPEYLGILAESVRSQAGGTRFEWLVLDNGTTHPETLWVLEQIGRLPFVRLERVQHNLGIIGGMRWCLENASGRYMVPLDSDDYLYEDAMLRVTEAIQAAEYPPLLYTDEDLLMDEKVYATYHKPEWDPVLFSDSCYIAHMGVIERAFALELGAYTDPATEGSHDWDTFTRFVNAGIAPVHVPHVLYSWRMHQRSTAAAIDSKPYVFESQKAVLSRFLGGIVRPQRFWLDKSPLFANTPDWWIRSTATNPPPMHIIRIGRAAAGELPSNGFPLREAGWIPADAPLSELVSMIAPIPAESLIGFVWDELTHDHSDWAWDAFTYLECFADGVGLGGPTFDAAGNVLSAGIVFGFGDGLGCPDRGRPRGDPGFFAQMWKHRSVDAVSSQNLVVRQGFLAQVLAAPEIAGFTVRLLGPVAGAHARRCGRRFIFSPFMASTAASDWEQGIRPAELGHFLRNFHDVLPDDRYYSRKFSLAAGQGYQLSGDGERERHLQRLIGEPLAVAA